jgi:hypothetical protein
MRVPRVAGDLEIITPAALNASNLAAAVPLPPETIAPACPILLPGGALVPAMKLTYIYIHIYI